MQIGWDINLKAMNVDAEVRGFAFPLWSLVRSAANHPQTQEKSST